MPITCITSTRATQRAGRSNWRITSTSPEEFAAFVATELPKWAELVRISGATAG